MALKAMSKTQTIAKQVGLSETAFVSTFKQWPISSFDFLLHKNKRFIVSRGP